MATDRTRSSSARSLKRSDRVSLALLVSILSLGIAVPGAPRAHSQGASSTLTFAEVRATIACGERTTPDNDLSSGAYLREYRASDGEMLTDSVSKYGSARAAKRALSRTLATATRHHELGAALMQAIPQESGLVERVASTGRTEVLLIWAEGSNLYSVVGPNSRHVVALFLHLREIKAWQRFESREQVAGSPPPN